jgi:hypothetical protein
MIHKIQVDIKQGIPVQNTEIRQAMYLQDLQLCEEIHLHSSGTIYPQR